MMLKLTLDEKLILWWDWNLQNLNGLSAR